MKAGIEKLVSRFVSDLEKEVRNRALTEINVTLSKLGKKGVQKEYLRASKRRTEEDLAVMRGKIVAVVRQKPGMRCEEIQEATGYGPTDITLPLLQLVRTKQLNFKGVARGRKYWAK